MRRLDPTPFFAPRSIAVIVASRDPSKVEGACSPTYGVAGRVVAINPQATSVQGVPAGPRPRRAGSENQWPLMLGVPLP